MACTPYRICRASPGTARVTLPPAPPQPPLGTVVTGHQGTDPPNNEDLPQAVYGIPILLSAAPAPTYGSVIVSEGAAPPRSEQRTALTVFLLGFLCFPVWLIGIRYRHSPNRAARLWGRLSIFMAMSCMVFVTYVIYSNE
eukprot:TRINITY_DN94665_c0_g1_i1.p1 TRINITY_DN94665_c0_g1~~TRINITY_DN94665_c0_g1_i1.p1  ORF type:complete len:157 (+),score=12.08 TRINITY_DN94665_c0_g1_i1:54-473(+)